MDGIAALEVASDGLQGERVLDFALDGPFERPGAELRFVTHLGQPGARGGADFQAQAAVFQQFGHVAQLDANNFGQLFPAQGVK